MPAPAKRLPVATRTLWKNATGIELIDGIGATGDAAYLHLRCRCRRAPRRHRQALSPARSHKS
ncbi:hypothetical protein ACU4GD_07500 [Cupriavidus basilensis]